MSTLFYERSNLNVFTFIVSPAFLDAILMADDIIETSLSPPAKHTVTHVPHPSTW